MYMAVVVRYDDGEKTATILSAFPVDNIATGEGEITYVKRKR